MRSSDNEQLTELKVKYGKFRFLIKKLYTEYNENQNFCLI